MRRHRERTGKSSSKSSKTERHADSSPTTPANGVNAADGQLVLIGTVARAHGIRGELVVRCDPDTRRTLRPKLRVVLRKEGQALGEFTVRSNRTVRDTAVVAFAEVDDRTSAQSLAGARLYVHRASLPHPGRDAYYDCDIVGLEARTPTGERLGSVTTIVATGANDVWIVRNEAGEEFLAPAVGHAILEVNADAGYIVIEPRACVTPDE